MLKSYSEETISQWGKRKNYRGMIAKRTPQCFFWSRHVLKSHGNSNLPLGFIRPSCFKKVPAALESSLFLHLFLFPIKLNILSSVWSHTQLCSPPICISPFLPIPPQPLLARVFRIPTPSECAPTPLRPTGNGCLERNLNFQGFVVCEHYRGHGLESAPKNGKWKGFLLFCCSKGITPP